MPLLIPNQPPPAGYYANNLLTLIKSVCDQYRDLLTVEESRMAGLTLSLSEPAIRLLARLVSRTKALIRVDSLRYIEIDDVVNALDELQSASLISLNTTDSVEDVLNLLTIAELRCFIPDVRMKGRKPTLVETIRTQLDEGVILDQLTTRYPWLRVEATRIFDFFCLLFFGNVVQGLDEFVIRDLGITRFESYRLDPAYRLFKDRRAIERYLELHELSEHIETMGRTVTVEVAEAVISTLERPETDRVSEWCRSRALNALGRNLERTGAFACALRCYERSTLHPARERTMRILHGEGEIDQVETLRNDILLEPQSYEEYEFAARFKRPKTQKLPIDVRMSVAPLLKDQKIEDFAVSQLRSDGYQAWHLENCLPGGLFGLAYWEWLYAPVRGAFVNPFQSAPLDLYWPEFFDVRRAACEDPLQQPKALKSKILETAEAKCGITNQLVAWSAITTELLKTILDAISTDQLISLLSIMTTDLRQFRGGFPDLTIVNHEGTIAFREVKGPGDQLRPNQRLWIERLTQAQFDVCVWRFE